jgi:hypothetical protein
MAGGGGPSFDTNQSADPENSHSSVLVLALVRVLVLVLEPGTHTCTIMLVPIFIFEVVINRNGLRPKIFCNIFVFYFRTSWDKRHCKIRFNFNPSFLEYRMRVNIFEKISGAQMLNKKY